MGNLKRIYHYMRMTSTTSKQLNVETTTLKIGKKIKLIFVIILGLAGSFKIMNLPDPGKLGPTVTIFDG